MNSKYLKRFTGIFLSLMFALAMLPVLAAKDTQKPKKARRAKTVEELLEYKNFPVRAPYSEDDVQAMMNPHMDLDRAREIREETYGDTDEGIEKMQAQYQDYRPLTLEQAIADVDYFIELMKIASLDYNRVGGKKAYKKFRKRVVERLEDRLYQTGQIYAIDLERAMARHIRFIDNQHFWLGPTYNSPYENRIEYREYYGNYPADGRWMRYEAHFMCDNLTFQKEGDNYRCYQNKKRINRKWMREAGIEMVPCWTKNFKIVYRLHYYGRTLLARPAEARFKDGSKLAANWVFSTQMGLTPTQLGYPEGELTMINDVPYVNLSGDVYSEADPDTPSTQRFKEIGETMREYSCGIIDLRYNGGGHPYPLQYLLAGYNDMHYQNFRFSGHHLQFTSFFANRGDYKITMGNDVKHKADGILIVLVNNVAASGGDLSIDYLRHQTNTLIVGDATSGLITSYGGYKYFLPNSGMYISVPGDHMFWDPDYYQEARGFYPDIWTMTDNIDLEALADYLKDITAASEKNK